MLDIRELDNSVDLKDQELVTKLNWDVVSYGNQYVEFNVTDSEVPGFNIGDEKMVFFDYQIPLQIYRIKGYYHCIYGTGEEIKDHILSPSFDWFAEERKRSREFLKGN